MIRFKHFICTLSLLMISHNAVASSLPATVQPNIVRLGHAEQIRVNLTEPHTIKNISVMPGGPYIQKAFTLPAPASHMDLQDDIIWLAYDKSLAAYQATKANDFSQISQIETATPINTFRINHNTLYVLDKQGQLTTWDISRTAQPKKNATYPFEFPIQSFSIKQTNACLQVRDDHIIATSTHQLKALPAPYQHSQNITAVYAISSGCLILSQNGIHRVPTGSRQASDHFPLNQLSFAISMQADKLAIANGDTGLTYLSNDFPLRWLGSYNKLGTITKIASDGTQTLVSDDENILTLFDHQQPDTPLLQSDIQLNNPIHTLHYKNNTATVLTDKQLLQIDFSAQSPPVISHIGVNLGGSRRAYIDQHILYVADWFSGIHIYDIRVPHMPRLLANYHTPGSPKGIIVRHPIAFVADDDHGLQIIDVSNPRQPTQISSLPLTGLAYTMKLVDNLLYVASHHGGFHIIDITIPSQPKRLGGVDTPGKSWAIDIHQNTAFVADDNSGLLIFDVKDPSQPQWLATFNPDGFAEDVIVQNNIAYVAFFDQGLHILDASNPIKPLPLSHLPTVGNARGLALQDQKLYLASWKAGIQIIDISNKQAPHVLGHYDTKGFAWGINVQGEYAYVLDWWGGIKIFNVHNADQIHLTGQYQTSGKINDLALKSPYAYLANGSRSLQIFDITNSLNPVWAAGLDFEGSANAIALSATHAYIAAGDAGLVVVDISNPFQPIWQATLKLNQLSADKIYYYQQQIFIAEQNGQLAVVDVSDPAAPFKRTRLSHHVKDFSGFQNTLAVLSQTSHNEKTQLQLIDISQQAHPRLLADTYLTTPADLVSLHDLFVFTAHPGQGIRSFRWSHNSLQAVSMLPINDKVADFMLVDSNLFISVKNHGIHVAQLIDNGDLSLAKTYQTSRNITKFQIVNQAIFLAGETTLVSAKLLPNIEFQYENNAALAHIPNNMPAGSYHLSIESQDKSAVILHNAFEVGFPKPKKSHFTMQDLKKIMQQKSFAGKTPNPSKPMQNQ